MTEGIRSLGEEREWSAGELKRGEGGKKREGDSSLKLRGG